MGKMKELDIEYATIHSSFMLQKEFWQDVFSLLPRENVEKHVKNARGDLKVIMHTAYTDLEE